jgi:hypothetical protein
MMWPRVVITRAFSVSLAAAAVVVAAAAAAVNYAAIRNETALWPSRGQLCSYRWQQ